MKKKVLIALAFILAASALAPLLANATLGPATRAYVEDTKSDGLYRVTNFKEINATAYIVNGKTIFPENEETSYVLLENEPIRAEFLPNGTVRITRGTTPAEEEINPSKLIVPAEQFKQSDLEPINDPLGRDLTTLYVSFISKESAQARAGSAAFAGRCTISNWGDGGCVRYIKGTEQIKGTLGSGGRVAGTLHSSYGYKIVDRSTCESNPPVGTIASWAGHVAKWDGSCWRTDVPAACSCNHGDPGRGHTILCVIR